MMTFEEFCATPYVEGMLHKLYRKLTAEDFDDVKDLLRMTYYQTFRPPAHPQ